MVIKNPVKVILLRLVNFYRGSSVKPFGNVLRKIYLKYLQKRIRENRQVLAEIDGIKYRLNLNQPSEFETYFGGGYEPTVIKIINKYVKPGDIVMDIGARIGLHTLRMKKLVGQEGKVLAIEPDKESFSLLMENAGLNNFSILAENLAFSDRTARKEITLDGYMENKGFSHLDFIKLDTDGWEYKILQGGLATLKKFKPVMVVEFNKDLLEDGRLERMIDLLEGLGYSFSKDKKSIISEVAVKGNVNILCQVVKTRPLPRQ